MQSTENVCAVRLQIYINTQSRWPIYPLWIFKYLAIEMLWQTQCTHWKHHSMILIHMTKKNSDFLSHLSASGEWVGTQNCSSGPRCLTSHCGLTTEHFHFYFRIKSFCFATEAHIQIQTNTDTERLTHLFRFSSLHKLNSPQHEHEWPGDKSIYIEIKFLITNVRFCLFLPHEAIYKYK